MTKSHILTSLHSEKCLIPAWLLRGSEVCSPGKFLFRFYDNRHCWHHKLNIVTRSLDKSSVCRPLRRAIISVHPWLLEILAWCDNVIVWNAFFYKSTLKTFFFWLSKVTFHGVDHFFFNCFVHNIWLRNLLTWFVLANNWVRSLGRFTDLEHGMLIENSFGFTSLTKVVVMADGALVSYTNDWVHTTSITDVWFMILMFLFGSFLFKVIVKKSSELSRAVFCDLLSYKRADLLETFSTKYSCSVASSARKPFFINLGTLAFETRHLLLDCFFCRVLTGWN